jgi:mannan endo-1,4-beta-mannosidase
MKAKHWILVLLALTAGLGFSGCNHAATPTPPPTATTSPTAPTATVNPDAAGEFVSVADGKFMLAGEPYYFVGANFWQGMNLGVNDASGDRAQLGKELDHLRELGVTNLRVMASSEGPDTEPHRMVPSLEPAPGEYNQNVLDGMDYLLAQMGKRGMRAVMVLNNFWYWSGGMAQYVSWSDGSAIPYPGDYNAYMEYTSRFYYCQQCQTLYRNHIQAMIQRVNAYSGLAYRDDPAIFSWELANEPRRYPQEWISGTAAYIKSLDPNHMITTGSEGTPPGETIDFLATHGDPNIDYATIHIWPQNWGWYDPQNPSTYNAAEGRAHLYFANRAADALALKKPLVLEEFGLARDWEPLHDLYDVGSRTTYRDRFYKAMYDQVYASMTSGGPAGGDNFWAWAGQARPGDPWIGDPPHETAGWYSVYDTDPSTLTIISNHARDVASLP